MDTIISDEVRKYYARVATTKIGDFIDGNARCEAAWHLIRKNMEPATTRILEIGCGIGFNSWRLSINYPEAEIHGIDVSPESIDIARKLFAEHNLHFHSGLSVPEIVGQQKFEMIILMDVYEHVPVPDRNFLHQHLHDILSPDGKLILTFPNPEFLNWLRANKPSAIQPVDENIDLPTLATLAHATATTLRHYEFVSIWRRYDYVHAVLTRLAPLAGLPPGSRARLRTRLLNPALAKRNIWPARSQRLAMVRRQLGLNLDHTGKLS